MRDKRTEPPTLGPIPSQASELRDRLLVVLNNTEPETEGMAVFMALGSLIVPVAIQIGLGRELMLELLAHGYDELGSQHERTGGP